MRYRKKHQEAFEKAKEDAKCDCRNPHPLIVFAKMPDGSWHEPGCNIPQRYIELIKMKATGKICNYEGSKKYLCHHKKGFDCEKCIQLIKGVVNAI